MMCHLREAASFPHKCGAVPAMAPQNLSVALLVCSLAASDGERNVSICHGCADASVGGEADLHGCSVVFAKIWRRERAPGGTARGHHPIEFLCRSL